MRIAPPMHVLARERVSLLILHRKALLGVDVTELGDVLHLGVVAHVDVQCSCVVVQVVD